MKLSDHFELEEFLFSDTAIRKGLKNIPAYADITNLQRIAGVLERVRALLGNKPIHINSGFRSVQLNAAIGGAKNSAHLEGRAVDFTCRQFGSPLEIVKAIMASDISFDQLIEEGTWVHISVPRIGETPRKQVLTATFKGGKATYSEGITNGTNRK